MEKYKIVTTISDFGPYISKLILLLPCEIRENDISVNSFNVYVEKKDIDTGEIIFKEGPDKIKYPLKGYQKILKAYPCDDKGNKCYKSKFAALELAEESLGKRIEANILKSKYVKHDYRIVLLHDLPDIIPVNGLIFDDCTEDICPQLNGWQNGTSSYEKLKLNYGYFSPDFEKLLNPKPDLFGNIFKLKSEKLPLIVWLHGAGEGGSDTKIAYTGNKVVNLSSTDIQKKLGGGAWILVPQCPTVWMDDGVEQLGKSNKSIYTEALKACIDEFIAKHEDKIDKNKIYIGGLSNGGFMTIRMLIDYPDFFAGAIPVCEGFYKENITEEIIRKLKNIPIWFVHSKGDELLPPQDTVIPLYKELKKAGAENVHFTYFDHVEDLTGMYKDDFGRPQKFFNHGVWVHVYNDHCFADIDGSYVMHNEEPVTLWEWLGKQCKNKNAE